MTERHTVASKLTYKRQIIVDNLKVMWVGYWCVFTVLVVARATHRVAHALKPMEAIARKHLFAVVAETTQAHAVTC